MNTELRDRRELLLIKIHNIWRPRFNVFNSEKAFKSFIHLSCSSIPHYTAPLEWKHDCFNVICMASQQFSTFSYRVCINILFAIWSYCINFRPALQLLKLNQTEIMQELVGRDWGLWEKEQIWVNTITGSLTDLKAICLNNIYAAFKISSS